MENTWIFFSFVRENFFIFEAFFINFIMKLYCLFWAVFYCVMKKAAWGQKKHNLPSLDEICRYSTGNEVAGYLVGNELIENKNGNECGKVCKYEYSSMTKPPCTGTLSLQGPFARKPNKVYWRCWKCKDKYSIFRGTVLEKFNLPLPQILQTLYLAMLNIPVSRIIAITFYHVLNYCVLIVTFSKDTLL